MKPLNGFSGRRQNLQLNQLSGLTDLHNRQAWISCWRVRSAPILQNHAAERLSLPWQGHGRGQVGLLAVPADQTCIDRPLHRLGRCWLVRLHSRNGRDRRHGPANRRDGSSDPGPKHDL